MKPRPGVTRKCCQTSWDNFFVIQIGLTNCVYVTKPNTNFSDVLTQNDEYDMEGILGDALDSGKIWVEGVASLAPLAKCTKTRKRNLISSSSPSIASIVLLLAVMIIMLAVIIVFLQYYLIWLETPRLLQIILIPWPLLILQAIFQGYKWWNKCLQFGFCSEYFSRSLNSRGRQTAFEKVYLVPYFI